MEKEMLRCNECGNEFDKEDAVNHWKNNARTSDWTTCPFCESEDLEEI